MTLTILPTISEEAELRTHLKHTLEDLPNNLPQYNETRLLADLIFLLRSPLFLYTIAPRLTTPVCRGTPEPPTPMSMMSDLEPNKPFNAFDVSSLEIRVKWDYDSWATQLVYGDNMLLEGRQLNVEQGAGFVQSFWWFCEEASFLAYEYKAREDAAAVMRGEKVAAEGLAVFGGDEGIEAAAPERYKTGSNRRSLKLKFRFRDTVMGPAGVWRVW